MNAPILIANYLIERALEEGRDVTPMKVLKLVYLAHGWHLAVTGEELISEGVQAWKYGPVVESIYHAFKHYGKYPIKSLKSDGENNFPREIKDETSRQIVDAVWGHYKNMSGPQLSALTHEKGSPWFTTWEEKGGKNGKNVFISNDLIRDFYRGFFNKNTQPQSA